MTQYYREADSFGSFRNRQNREKESFSNRRKLFNEARSE